MKILIVIVILSNNFLKFLKPFLPIAKFGQDRVLLITKNKVLSKTGSMYTYFYYHRLLR